MNKLSLSNNLIKLIKYLSLRLEKSRVPNKIVFVIIGTLSTIWFLVRVIPKPNRAEYPCMKVAYPLMSSFVVYLVGLSSAVFAFGKSKQSFVKAKYFVSFLFLLISFFALTFTLNSDSSPVYANSKSILGSNQPVGIAKGILPGRVVWVWNPKSTNENCTNQFGDGWFMDKNTDLNVVAKMVDESIIKLTEKNNLKESWDALFKYFNLNHGKGNVGYKENEKIFIRTNQVSASDNTIDADYTVKNTTRYGMAETSPQVALAVLRQLVNQYGVKQENISLGDPMKHMYKHFYEMLHNEFPNVTYLDFKGTLGRTKPISNIKATLQYSDRGTILKSSGTTGTPVTADYLPTVITDADYIIAIPALKAHARAGVTLCGKLHFGSNLRGSAAHLHGGLVSPDKATTRPGYKNYRVQVDLMGHKDLGNKTVLFLLDGLWAGSEANDPPRKFSMSPFNNDWTSSIFASQDQVALESVGFDFLKTEFTSTNQFGSYPQMEGADDHILQAADSSYWPANIKYDPENDGTQITSLGVFEHWNNSIDKQYTRNLRTGNGIELLYIKNSATSILENQQEVPAGFKLCQNYPNPFNPTTTIEYSIPAMDENIASIQQVTLKVYDVAGRLITTLVDEYKQAGNYKVVLNINVGYQQRQDRVSTSMASLSSGVYYYRLQAGNYSQTKKLILLK